MSRELWIREGLVKVDSKEACDILDSEAKRWGERDIESFVTFLKQKFDCHAKKLKKKLSNVNSLALQDMLGANALELKDVLPTISSMDTALLQPIECSICRKSFDETFYRICRKSFDEMIEEPTISLDVDMVSTNNIPQVEATLSIGQEIIMGSYEHEDRIWPGGHGTITVIYYDMYTKADTIGVEYSSNDWKHDQIPTKYIKILPEDMNRNAIEYKEVAIDDVGEEVLAKIDAHVRNGMEQIQKALKAINNLCFGIQEGLNSLYPTPEQKDIELVMSQAGCKRANAIKALQ